MTLIVAIGNMDQVIQLSDRRITVMGKVKDDEFNKACDLRTRDSRLTYGFSGLAEIGDLATSKWIIEKIMECCKSYNGLNEFIILLCKKIDYDFNNLKFLKKISKKNKKLSVIFTGYFLGRGEPKIFYALISNYQRYNPNELYHEAKDHFMCSMGIQKDHVNNLPIILAIGCSDGWKPPDIRFLRNLLKRRVSKGLILREAVKCFRNVAESNKVAGLVGKQISSIIIPPKHSVDCEAYYHPEKENGILYGPSVINAINPNCVVTLGYSKYEFVDSLEVDDYLHNDDCKDTSV